MTEAIVNSFSIGFGFTLFVFFTGYCIHLLDFFTRVR